MSQLIRCLALLLPARLARAKTKPAIGFMNRNPGRRFFTMIMLLGLVKSVFSQAINQNKAINKQAYLAELKTIGQTFTRYFYPNYDKLYALPEEEFIVKIDSVRHRFNALLGHYKNTVDRPYFNQQQLEIRYYFDQLLIAYPANHDTSTGKTSKKEYTIPKRLARNRTDFNKPELLTNRDFTDYVRAYLTYRISRELQKEGYAGTDNQQLRAVWTLIPLFFSNTTCRTFWQSEYLHSHIDNNGIKNIQAIYAAFKANCQDSTYLHKVTEAYSQDSIGRQGHLIKTYKTVGAQALDIHIFLPDSLTSSRKRPVMVYFHGGSWSEGKPDWFFLSCANYAKQGWVACAVEYRTYGRFGTLPFAAVMDARSAIRWLRQQANVYGLDTAKIVASGNSAGGHLALCTALADEWNEQTDELTLSPIPSALLINAGVYDLTDRNTAWIRKDLPVSDLVKSISPLYLINKHLPPALIFHGTKDQNVPFVSAVLFVESQRQVPSSAIDFHPLEGAGHFIWFDPAYSSDILKLSRQFLNGLGY